ncbi:uncharacterized protein LOC114363457 isoform X1 [Ostrinia furnacalis]|uniref:uncharacterized protein LOC114363457 isoform X1 n=1 Tax=Ostrinia furnacalis TaxID=93504 RepID=UPI0010394E3C|nr:uncharacterized protein LOC114363457 isoform X1 [Ostrinia furnacalis]
MNSKGKKSTSKRRRVSENTAAPSPPLCLLLGDDSLHGQLHVLPRLQTITDPTRSRRSAETVGEHVVNKAGMIGTRIGFFSGPDTYWPA